jgi:NADH-quinone oxidoreductase subunit N
MLATTTGNWFPNNQEVHELGLLAPEFIFVGAIAAALIVPFVTGRRSEPIAGLSLIAAVLVGLSCLTLIDDLFAEGGGAQSIFRGMFIFDSVSLFFKMFLSVFLIGVILLWFCTTGRREQDAPEFFTLILGSAMGMGLMASTQNLLMIVLAIELASLPSYALAGFRKTDTVGAEASLKYVLFGAVASAVMLYGVSLLYGYFGTLDVGEIARIYAGSESGGLIFAIALAAFAAGIAFKISAVPFHFWCPDVFQGAMIEVTTWLSVASKAAGLLLLLRIVWTLSNPGSPTFDAASALQPLAIAVAVISVITMTVGNLAALAQTNLKRLLAYSSIAHAGYMLSAGAILTGVLKSGGGESVSSISAVMAYLIVYLFMNLGAFGVVALVHLKTGSESIEEFTGLGSRATGLAVCMAVILFSLIGLPPLGGFAAKYLLFVALVRGADGAPWLWLVIIAAALNTVISLFYYIKIVRVMFLESSNRPKLEVPPAGLALVGVCAVVVFATFLWLGRLGEAGLGFASRVWIGAPGAAEIAAAGF